MISGRAYPGRYAVVLCRAKAGRKPAAVKILDQYVRVSRLERFALIAARLEDFWLDPANQAVATWTGHRDINAVTLAACLAPEGALGKLPRSGR